MLILLLAGIFMTGCWDRMELEDQAFVQTIAIDKGPSNQLLVTFRIAIPSKSGLGTTSGGSGGEGSVAAQSSLLTTVAAPSIPAAITMASGYVNRELNLTQTKVFLFGEPFARQGVGRVMSFLARYRQLRRSAFVAVSKGEAYKIFQANAPDLEKSYSKFWEGVKNMQSREAIHPGTLFHEFIADVESDNKQATSMYFSINDNAGRTDAGGLKTPPSFDGGKLGVKGGEIPRIGGNPMEYVGTAVFEEDKMVDVLTLQETTAFLMLTGKFSKCFYTLPDPQQKDGFIPLEIKQGSPPIITVNNDEEALTITEEMSLEGDLLGTQTPSEYAVNLNQQKVLIQALENDIKDNSMALLGKFQKRGIDIVGYKDYGKRNFLTDSAWKNFKWKEKYRDAAIKVEVNFAVRRTGMQGKQPDVFNQSRKQTQD